MNRTRRLTVVMQGVGRNFADRLVAAIKSKGNPVCVGLDPRVDQLPKALRERAVQAHGPTPRAAAEAIIEFNCALLDAVADLVPVCKPQIAFYEEHGPEGLRAFAETVRYAQARGLLVIADAKRGDIGSTAEAYARAFLSSQPGAVDADALTVNPYMGADTLRPYLEPYAARGKGIFVLVKTSNEGSGRIQDLLADGWPVHEQVADMVGELGGAYGGASGFSAVGAVVGATYPEQAQRLRELLPDTFFLVPGYGAQGATASDVAACFRPDGLGAVVNSSRGIIFAYKQEPYASRFGEARFAEAARAATEDMIKDLRAAVAAM